MNFGQRTYSGQGRLVEREPREETAHTCCSLSHQPLARPPHWLNSIIIWKAQEPWRGSRAELPVGAWRLAANGEWICRANRGSPHKAFRHSGVYELFLVYRVCASCCGGCRLLTPKYKKKTWKQNINAYLNISRKQNIISSSLIITFSVIVIFLWKNVSFSLWKHFWGHMMLAKKGPS